MGTHLPTHTAVEPAMTILPAVSSTIAAMTASSTTAAPASASGSPHDSPEGECQLLGSFALIVQAALGALALLSLVYKRYRERPQRPLKIWFFDVSKQVFGSVLVHIANIFMSMLTSGRFSIKLEPGTVQARADEPYVPNPCSFYLLNLGIDTTLGIPILIVLLKIITGLVALTPLGKPAESIQSGNYGNPPSAWWWLKQSVIYFCGLFGMKVCVLVIFIFMPWISKVGDWALSWTEGNEKLQIAFVMMIFPLIMNALQYYIIDSFIKMKEPEHQRLPSDDPDHGIPTYSGTQLRSQAEGSDADDSDGDGRFDSRSRPLRPRNGLQSTAEEEYNPDVDGDAPTVIGSSSSRARLARTKVSTELYPKE
ncbi:FK506-binding protein 2 precursor [Metarhizium album ARSEF 1941]|uniref:FK506-binding protein 2 n=1 Tax=Metarhizium album (strain ARSEF 1941) TaxID=1081103 RepID=A0A0B2WU39_METAS|nr:FK506-binding protein 2 precursor [Metarhizium album ARSEF 1941]KHN96435.1 FK506-binding protein 2 precursor [Metarhizium album ARSEF 1941]